MFYKNVVKDEIVGITESDHALNVLNFFEISEEEYISLGGIPTKKDNGETSESVPYEALIDAILQ